MVSVNLLKTLFILLWLIVGVLCQLLTDFQVDAWSEFMNAFIPWYRRICYEKRVDLVQNNLAHKKVDNSDDDTYIVLDDAKHDYLMHDISPILPSIVNEKCGSCWSITTASVASWVRHRASGEHVIISPQEILECSNGGNCKDGGHLDIAMNYLLNRDFCTITEYPYIDEFTGVCRKEELCKKKTVGFQIRSRKKVKATLNSFNEALKHSPVLTTIDFTHLGSPPKGIRPWNGLCEKSANHAVLIIGRAILQRTTPGKPKIEIGCWILFNNHGPTWGNNGLLYLQKDTTPGENKCGIMNNAYTASTTL